MRIFLTGASGFLGSYLAADLLDHGHQVAALLRSGSADWRLDPVRERVTAIEGTLDNIAALHAPLRDFRPDAVVHMAWRGVGNIDRNNPAQARNIANTVDLVALAADVGATVFVGAGSQAEYGPYDRIIRPDDVARPTTLYGQAKLAAGSRAAKIAQERGLRFAWLRIFSTYGPKDADTWLIPSFIQTVGAGQRMTLTGCEQKWGFLHTRDAVAAFRIVLAAPRGRGLFNLGHPVAPPLRETLTRLRDMIDASAVLGFGDIPYRPDQVMILQADIGRLNDFGWEPRVPLETGLRETVDWYVGSQQNRSR